MTHSVVNSIPATEDAFSSATLTTFAGSITPALYKLSKVSVFALKPKSFFPSFTLATITSGQRKSTC